MSEESTLWQVALLDRGESLVVMGRKKYDELYESMQELTKERDEARAEMDEFAISVGYGVRPEGQSGVHRLHGEQLADRWKQIERECDELRAEVEQLREAARQVHAWVKKGRDWNAVEAIREIHKITKGMVE